MEFLLQSSSITVSLLSIFVCSNTYFYLSLPVFSHWQGRLDPRVMILGLTRRGKDARGGGPGRDRGLRAGSPLRQHAAEVTLLKGREDPPIVKTGTRVMKVVILLLFIFINFNNIVCLIQNNCLTQFA